MATLFDPFIWKDEVTEYPYRYTETQNSDGTIEHTPAHGEELQAGTPQSATNFNYMMEGLFYALAIGAEHTRNLIHMGNAVDALTGEKLTATLTNTQAYPHNNSETTLQLSESRNNTDYTVDVEVVSTSGDGGVGHFEISDKLVNGFKIAYTGGASEVVVNCYVRG